MPTAPGWFRRQPDVDFPDYALWQGAQHQAQTDELRAFWARQFEGGPGPLRLPEVARVTDYAAPTGTVSAPLGETVPSLAEFAAGHHTTPFIAVHAALAVVLARRSGTADVVIGASTSARTHQQLGPVVGMFARATPLRTTIDLDTSFTEILAHVTERDLAAFDHADLPLSEIAALVDPGRDDVATGLFEIFLADIVAGPAVPDACVAPPQARFGLDFALVTDTAGSTSVELRYLTSVAAAEVARGLVDEVVGVLAAAVAAPQVPAVDHLIGDGPPPAGGHHTSPDLAATAAKPDGTQWARRLIAHGIGPGDVVAICGGRSPWSILAMHAIMKTGAAFVHVLAADPPARRQQMLIRSGATAGLRSPGSVVDGLELDWLTLDADDVVEPVGQPFSPDERTRRILPDDLAYVSFTSGTTGEPKAVMINRRGLGTLVNDVVALAHIGPQSRVLHNYSPGFDAHLIELLPAHEAGATVVVCPPDIIGGVELEDLIRSERITVFFSTPSVLATMDPGRIPEVQTIVVGGEALPASTARLWGSAFALLNLYGPTETMVAVTADAPIDPSGPITIGRPLTGVAAYVLDERLRSVRDNTIGELYVSSPGMARGYADQAGETAQRFVADPFAPAPARMYRTGDLVHRRSDGRLVIHGRVDRQLNLRGMRVEPGEIDAVLGTLAGVQVSHTGVAHAVDGAEVLVSWVVPVPGDDVDVTEIKVALRGQLPTRLLPAAVIAVDAIPMTANGKVDSAALPGVGSELVETTPLTPMQARVARVWADTLAVAHSTVGGGTNFFERGGSSLLATQLTGRLGAEFGRPVPVRLLLDNPTPRQMAAALSTPDSRSSGAVAPLLDPGLVPIPDPLPLAPTQVRLWTVQQMAPDAVMYSIPVYVPIPAGVDLDAIAGAVREVSDRHIALRTSYPMTGSGPVQRVHRDHVPELVQVQVETPTAAANLAKRLKYHIDQPFDLTAMPPLRWLLIDGPDSRGLLLVAHHIAIDGESAALVSRDIGGALAGDTPEPPSVDFAQVTAWERATLEQLGPELREFWTAELVGYSGVLDIAPHRPRVRSTLTRTHTVTIDDALTWRIGAVTERLGASEFQVLHAALALVLSVYGGTDDVAIGTPHSLRPYAGTDDVVGMMVSTIVLRTVLTTGLDTDHLVDLVRRADLVALDHALLPFDELVTILDLPRDGGRHPLVQVALSYLGGATAEAGSYVWGVEALFERHSEFDLALTVSRTGHGMSAAFTYAVDLFDHEFIAAFTGHWLRALDVVASPVATPIDVAELWNGRSPEPAPPQIGQATLGQLFATAVRESPENAALLTDSITMTYRDLDRWSTAIARWLRERGVKPADRVAVELPRSAGSVATFWGVMKIGAVYVPIDPNFPESRRTRMYARAAITATVNAQNLPPVPDAPVASIGEPGVAIDSPAVLLFTSGTTGEPNAVVLTHRGMGKFAGIEQLSLRSQDRFAHAASPSFDAALFEMLLPVLCGAALCVLDSDIVGGPRATEALARFGVSWMFATPSVLATLDERVLVDLRVLMVGGEACSDDLVRRWSPNRLMLNGYGPTEATMCVALGPLHPGTPILIGNPVPDISVEVLDTHLRSVPDGVTGELYLSGPPLADGYFGDTASTAARFVAGPDGRRRYRTGDRVRRRPDGLDYVGRVDQQLKLRGQRVEPAEIDAALVALGARQSATVSVAGPAGDVLVSYVAGPATLDAERLRTAGAAVLPRHMVPARIVVVDELPRTPVGKLDAGALPAPSWSTGPGASPRTAMAALVLAAFRETLNTNLIGATDDFFRAGGDSLAATRAAALIESRTGSLVPVRLFFDHPTADELADAVALSTAARLPNLHDERFAAGAGDLIPLAPNQHRLWYVHKMMPGASLYSVPIHIPVPAGVDESDVMAALRVIIERHTPLRTRYPDTAHGPMQYVHAAFEPRIWRLDETDHGGAEAVLADVQQPFDIENEPPVRVVLLAGPGRLSMYLIVHHIAADGDSAAILAAEMLTLLTGGELDALPVDFGRVARWQAALVDSVRDEQLTFWRDTLGGYAGILEPAPDRPRVRSHATSSVSIPLGEGIADRIAAVSARLAVTEFHIAHAALALALSVQAGVDDVAIGTPVSVRRHPDVLPLVGMLVSTVVLRTRFRPGQTADDLLVSVRDADLAALDNALVPFDLVVTEIDPPRDPSRHPLVQTTMTYTVTDTGGYVDGREVAGPDSEFDLQVDVTRSPNGLAAVVTYGTDLFTSDFICSFGERFGAALDALTATEATSLDRIDLRLPRERPDLAAPPITGPGSTLGSLMADAVQNHPTATALTDGRRSLTYRELDDWASVTAAHLRDKGVGAGQPVAVVLARSIDSVVAFWAVARLGAVYVPVDPRFPEGRIERMISEVEPAVVMTDGDVPVQPAAADGGIGYTVVHPDSTAYIVFTSGTSGTPNAVAITHRGLEKFGDVEILSLRSDDRFAHIASPSFDAAVFEMLLPILCGGRLCVLDSDTVGGSQVTAQLADFRATWMLVTPSVLGTLDHRLLPDLRILVVGGEPCPGELLRRWGVRRRMLNAYGPSEATVCVVAGELDPGSPIVIGDPLPDTSVEVLDAHLRPVPPGTVGELYLAGPSLAAGYANSSALTAARFVAGPDGRRRYRTGDLVRWTPTGLDYRGRADRQLKIRGQRTEPAEVDAVLMAAGATAAVTVPVHRGSELTLVSYVVDRFDPLDEQAGLRAACRRELPRHMVPADIVRLDALPTTPVGKLDVAALPAPSHTGEQHREPSSPSEALVLSIVRDVLGDHTIGVDEDFFAAGGNSLTLMRVAEQLSERTPHQIPVAPLFDNPSAASIAAALDGIETASGALAQVLDLSADGAAGNPIWCVHPGGGLAGDYRPLGTVLAPTPVLGLQLPGLADPTEPIVDSIADLAAAHLAAVRERQPLGPYRLVGWSLGGAVAHEMAHQLEAAGEVVQSLVLIDVKVVPEPTDGSTGSPEALDADIAAGLERIDPVRYANYRRRLGAVVADAHLYRPRNVAAPVLYVAAQDNTDPRQWSDAAETAMTIVSVPFNHADLGSPDAMTTTGGLVRHHLADLDGEIDD